MIYENAGILWQLAERMSDGGWRKERQGGLDPGLRRGDD
jgi:hypothetical protein